MNKNIFFTAMAALILSACGNQAKQQPETVGKNTASEEPELIFVRGPKASDKLFTGTAYVNELVPKSDSTAYAIGDVVFEPGCRNNWHTHQVRQIMLVTEGKGWYQERGKEAIPLKKGDVYIIPADVEHWHGATKDSRFVHIVVTDYQDDSCVIWSNPVTDEEYNTL